MSQAWLVWSGAAHSVVIHRGDEAIHGWRNWLREDPLVNPYRWLRADPVPPAPFLQCNPLIQLGLMRNSEKPGFPTFVALDKGRPALRNSLFCLVELPQLTGEMLEGVVRRKSATAGSLDGWGWRELEVLPVAWEDEFGRIQTKVEELGVWPEGLLDAYIAMLPKADGDATPLGQRPLSVLPVAYRIWASARMVQLEDWFRSWVPVSAWYTTAPDVEEVLAGAVGSDVHLFVADVVRSFDTVVRSIFHRVLSSLGLLVRLRFELASGLGEPRTWDGVTSRVAR